jgi:hypothetical protein
MEGDLLDTTDATTRSKLQDEHSIIVTLDRPVRPKRSTGKERGPGRFRSARHQGGEKQDDSGTRRVMPLSARAWATLEFCASNFPARQPSHRSGFSRLFPGCGINATDAMFFIYSLGALSQAVGRGFDPRLPLHAFLSLPATEFQPLSFYSVTPGAYSVTPGAAAACSLFLRAALLQ